MIKKIVKYIFLTFLVLFGVSSLGGSFLPLLFRPPLGLLTRHLSVRGNTAENFVGVSFSLLWLGIGVLLTFFSWRGLFRRSQVEGWKEKILRVVGFIIILLIVLASLGLNYLLSFGYYFIPSHEKVLNSIPTYSDARAVEVRVVKGLEAITSDSGSHFYFFSSDPDNKVRTFYNRYFEESGWQHCMILGKDSWTKQIGEDEIRCRLEERKRIEYKCNIHCSPLPEGWRGAGFMECE